MNFRRRIGIQMHADKGICMTLSGDPTALFKLKKSILVPCHADSDTGPFQLILQLSSQNQAKIFLDHTSSHRTSIMSAVTGIHDHQRHSFQ